MLALLSSPLVFVTWDGPVSLQAMHVRVTCLFADLLGSLAELVALPVMLA